MLLPKTPSLRASMLPLIMLLAPFAAKSADKPSAQPTRISNPFSLALNVHGAQPFPSTWGLMIQSEFGDHFRFGAGYGWSFAEGSKGSSVGIALTYFPVEWRANPGYSYRPVIGLGAARLFTEPGNTVHGYSSQRRIFASADLGVEMSTPTFADIGVGITVPVSPHSPYLPLYARLMVRF